MAVQIISSGANKTANNSNRVNSDTVSQIVNSRRHRRSRGSKKIVDNNNSDNDNTNKSRRKPSRRSRCYKARKNNNKSNNYNADEVSEEEQALYIAMDCEMVGVGFNGRSSAVARVTLVNWHHEIVLDQMVRPDRPITDYRTFVSGITPQDLELENECCNISTDSTDDSYNSSSEDTCSNSSVSSSGSRNVVDLATCRQMVLELLQGKILVGHALKNDLGALGIRHEWQYTRDTAKYEPFMKVRFDDGVLWPRKLRDLCHEKCNGMAIQEPGQAHSAYQDAVAALELYKSARTKWEKVMAYKIQKTAEIQQVQCSSSPPTQGGNLLAATQQQ